MKTADLTYEAFADRVQAVQERLAGDGAPRTWIAGELGITVSAIRGWESSGQVPLYAARGLERLEEVAGLRELIPQHYEDTRKVLDRVEERVRARAFSSVHEELRAARLRIRTVVGATVTRIEKIEEELLRHAGGPEGRHEGERLFGAHVNGTRP